MALLFAAISRPFTNPRTPYTVPVVLEAATLVPVFVSYTPAVPCAVHTRYPSVAALSNAFAPGNPVTDTHVGAEGVISVVYASAPKLDPAAYKRDPAGS